MWVTIYTAASWFPETKQGGWGFWAKSDKGRIVNHGKLPDWVRCNNSTEMAAILIGIIEVLQLWSDDVVGNFTCTDSTTALQYVKYRSKVKNYSSLVE